LMLGVQSLVPHDDSHEEEYAMTSIRA